MHEMWVFIWTLRLGRVVVILGMPDVCVCVNFQLIAFVRRHSSIEFF